MLNVLCTDNFATADLFNSPILTSLTVNCQSLLAKKNHFLIHITQKLIVFGTESWLNTDVLSSEAFPEGYSVYLMDCSDGYAGVFIACREPLNVI